MWQPHIARRLNKSYDSNGIVRCVLDRTGTPRSRALPLQACLTRQRKRQAARLPLALLAESRGIAVMAFMHMKSFATVVAQKNRLLPAKLPDSERRIRNPLGRMLTSSRWRAVHQPLKEIAMSKLARPSPTKPTKAKSITLQDVAKVQSRFAKTHGGKVPKGTWVARLQRAAQRNADTTTDTDF